jgi:phosphoribosyl-ATP pyrophosphohydrolase/phosphoribosyl-AMP cyclohydrolase
VLDRLDATIAGRAANTATGNSYTQRLLADSNLRLKKIGEESAELVHAAALGDRTRAVEEAADLLYHSLVALRALGASLADIEATLAARYDDMPPRGPRTVTLAPRVGSPQPS